VQRQTRGCVPPQALGSASGGCLDPGRSGIDADDHHADHHRRRASGHKPDWRSADPQAQTAMPRTLTGVTSGFEGSKKKVTQK